MRSSLWCWWPMFIKGALFISSPVVSCPATTSIFALPKNVPLAHFLNGRLQVRPAITKISHKNKKRTSNDVLSLVLVAGLEPARSISPRDFKSLVSAYSTTPANSGDPDGNRTRVTAVKGRCLNRLTTGPYGSGNRT